MNFSFGAIPLALTYLAFILHKSSEPFRLEEMMFFVIMLVATTTMDVVLAELTKTLKAILLTILLQFFTAAVVLYSAKLFATGSDSHAALTVCGVALIGIVTASTLFIQLFLYRRDQ